MLYQKISVNVTFDFRDPNRPLKAVKQKNGVRLDPILVNDRLRK